MVYLIIILIACVFILPIYFIATRKIAGLIIFFFFISILLFLWSLGADYNEVTTNVSGDLGASYSSLANVDLPSFLTFYLLAIIALVILWLRGKVLPPLLFVILMSLLVIGIVINFVLLIQIFWNKELGEVTWWLMFMPLIFNTTALVVLIKILKSDSIDAVHREYQSPFLNRLNKLMANTKMQPVWILVLMLPVYVLVTLILMLFGQAPDAMVKVFTDTSTWLLSQKAHPPYADAAGGHYLCTVAACGNPEMVKPLSIGSRHGKPIIVNRQLQIANAFEELMHRSAPALHRIIRKAYDNYGYPLSDKINTPRRSTITYLLMKPLEYFFVLCLYLFCIEPEKMIERQYKH